MLDEEMMDEQSACDALGLAKRTAKPKRQRVRLRDINVTAIALVNKAASGERFVIMKSAPDEGEEEQRVELIKRLEAMGESEFDHLLARLDPDEVHLVHEVVQE